LLDNAVRASPPGGMVALRVVQASDEAHIIVADSGTGMGPELARRAFEIGLSTWGGEGIGLTIAKFIAYHHTGAPVLRASPSGSVVVRTSASGTIATFAIPIMYGDATE